MSIEQQETNHGEKDMRRKYQNSAGSSRNPLFGIGAGFVAMIFGTLLWILVAQKYKMPMFSIVIAFGIAQAINFFGKAKEMWYGVIGALFSFIAAVAGNIATGIFIYCLKYPSMTPKAILENINLENAITLLNPIGMPMVVFCVLGSMGVGFWFSFKHTPKKKPMDFD